MIQRTYTLTGLNRPALDALLAGALGPVYGGFADHPTPQGFVVTVNLTSGAVPADIDTLNSLMAQYDPTALTPDQQARKQREAKLAEARREFKGEEVKPADYSGESAVIQLLAQKIAWLEQEIADIRGS